MLAACQYYAVSFFAQQAVEKALKAILVERHGGQQPPRSHDLNFLGRQLRVTAQLQTDLTVLFPIFDLARYPVRGRAPIDVFGDQ